MHRGLCSNFLADLRPPVQGGWEGESEEKIPREETGIALSFQYSRLRPSVLCMCSASPFKLPEDRRSPLVFVATGTGRGDLHKCFSLFATLLFRAARLPSLQIRSSPLAQAWLRSLPFWSTSNFRGDGKRRFVCFTAVETGGTFSTESSWKRQRGLLWRMRGRVFS